MQPAVVVARRRTFGERPYDIAGLDCGAREISEPAFPP